MAPLPAFDPSTGWLVAGGWWLEAHGPLVEVLQRPVR